MVPSDTEPPLTSDDARRVESSVARSDGEASGRVVREVTERYLTHSEEETAGVAANLAGRLPPGTVVLLYGALGAGKTAFVRGFVEGFGIAPDEVSSPTFTLIQQYGGDRRVYHVDLYRLGPEEVEDLGLEELPEHGGLVCIEWADRLPWPMAGAVSVRITDRGENTRELTIEGARIAEPGSG